MVERRYWQTALFPAFLYSKSFRNRRHAVCAFYLARGIFGASVVFPFGPLTGGFFCKTFQGCSNEPKELVFCMKKVLESQTWRAMCIFIWRGDFGVSWQNFAESPRPTCPWPLYKNITWKVHRIY